MTAATAPSSPNPQWPDRRGAEKPWWEEGARRSGWARTSCGSSERWSTPSGLRSAGSLRGRQAGKHTLARPSLLGLGQRRPFFGGRTANSPRSWPPREGRGPGQGWRHSRPATPDPRETGPPAFGQAVSSTSAVVLDEPIASRSNQDHAGRLPSPAGEFRQLTGGRPLAAFEHREDLVAYVLHSSTSIPESVHLRRPRL